MSNISRYKYIHIYIISIYVYIYICIYIESIMSQALIREPFEAQPVAVSAARFCRGPQASIKRRRNKSGAQSAHKRLT